MQPEEVLPGSPRDWMRHARSDLELARSGRAPGVLLEALCFHAQQAAEKSLKAVLVASGIAVPRTHNIKSLLDSLPERLSVPADIADAAILTDYAVVSRYPGDFEPVSEEEYREALTLATGVLKWAEAVLQAWGKN
ncbi:MAG: HEPN domain-containing protein [Chloroflexota bacterium]